MSQYGQPPGPPMGGPPGPGWFGSSMGNMGYGGYSYPGQMNAGGYAAGGAMGAGMLNFGANVAAPAMTTGAEMGAFFGAPMLMSAGAKIAGPRGIAYGMAGRGLAMHPANLAWGAASSGWAGGTAMGARMGMGMMGRGAMGLAAGGAMAAPFALAAYAASETVIRSAKRAYQGGRNVMLGTAFASHMGASQTGGAMGMGDGMSVGQAMGDMGKELGVSAQDISRLTGELGNQGWFTTVSSVKEWKQRFDSVLTAVKDISKTLQTSLEDATAVMGELRSQGFYTTSDVQAQASRTGAIAGATGMSRGQVLSAGRMGSQMGKAYGLTGRMGSALMQQQMGAMSHGMRHGSVSEFEVEEMGGLEQATGQLMASQMRFLRGARGRAMIAGVMGSDGRIDRGRMEGLLSGNMDMNDLVNNAVNQPLSVLRASGSREARESMAPYAGLAMMQTAMAQQRTLYGGVSQQGTIGMLGTMGMNRQQAGLLMQQVGSMPDYLRAQNAEASTMASQAAYADLRQSSSISGRMSNWSGHAFSGAETFGAGTVGYFQESWKAAGEYLTGRQEFTRGGETARGVAMDYIQRGGGYRTSGFQSERGTGEGLFGIPSLREQASGGIYDMLSTRSPGSADDIKLEGGRYISRANAGKAREIYAKGSYEGKSWRLTDDQKGQVQLEGRATQGLFERNLGQKVMSEYRWGTPSGTRAGQGSSGQRMTYAMAKELGVITDDVGYNEFVRDHSSEQRLAMQGEMYRAAKGAGMERVADILGDGVPKGNLSVIDLESSRRDTSNALDSFFADVENAITLPGGLKVSGTGKTYNFLSDELGKNGEGRAAFSEYLTALEQGGPLEQAQALQKAEGFLKSDKAKAELRDFGARMSTDPDRKRRALDGSTGLKSSIGQTALAEMVAPEMGQSATALRGYLEGGGGGHYKSELQAIQKASSDGRYADRRGMVGDLFTSIGKGGITDKELGIIGGLGTGGAMTLANLIRDVGGTSGQDGILELLTGAGVNDAEELSQTLAKAPKGSKRQEMLVKELADRGLLDDLAWTTGDKAKDIEGVSTDYADANRRFVLAVDQVVSKWEKQGIIPEGDASGEDGGWRGGMFG